MSEIPEELKDWVTTDKWAWIVQPVWSSPSLVNSVANYLPANPVPGLSAFVEHQVKIENEVKVEISDPRPYAMRHVWDDANEEVYVQVAMNTWAREFKTVLTSLRLKPVMSNGIVKSLIATQECLEQFKDDAHKVDGWQVVGWEVHLTRAGGVPVLHHDVIHFKKADKTGSAGFVWLPYVDQ